MTESSVYKPSRKGARPIPLSFTGRHLLQALREAVVDAVAAGDWHAHGGAVSRVRERIAQYMSDLEKKTERFFLGDVSDTQILDECERRGIGRVKLAPGIYDTRPTVVNVMDVRMRPTPPWQKRNRYLLEVVEKDFPSTQMLGYPISVPLQLCGSIEVEANSMEDALTLGIAEAAKQGHTLQRTDFTVRLLK